MSKADHIRVKAWCPLPLHRELSGAAAREGISMSAFILRAVAREVRRVERAAKRDAA